MVEPGGPQSLAVDRAGVRSWRFHCQNHVLTIAIAFCADVRWGRRTAHGEAMSF
jgi:hypothetical protein